MLSYEDSQFFVVKSSSSAKHSNEFYSVESYVCLRQNDNGSIKQPLKIILKISYSDMLPTCIEQVERIPNPESPKLAMIIIMKMPIKLAKI